MTNLEESEGKKRIHTRKPAAERKKEIVEMAIRLAAEVGPDRLTTEFLAQEIGISQAAIFRHFKNKGAIWEAVARHLGEKVRENWNSGDGSSPGAGGGTDGDAGDELFAELKHLVLAHFSTIQHTPALPAILFSRELHAENEKLRLFFVGMIDSFLSRLTSLIEVEIQNECIKSSVSAKDAASLILALVQGLALRWSLNNNGFNLVQEGERLLDLQLSCFTKQSKQGKL